MFTHAEMVTSALSRSSSGLKLPTLHGKDEKNVIAQLHQDNAKEQNQATMIITWANDLAATLGDAMNPLAMASPKQTVHAAMQ